MSDDPASLLSAILCATLFSLEALGKWKAKDVISLKAQGGAEVAGLNYSINLATMDCTGCEVCVESCPDDALEMRPYGEAAAAEWPKFEFAMSVPNKGHKVDKYSVNGSQFQQPLMEYSGACEGEGLSQKRGDSVDVVLV